MKLPQSEHLRVDREKVTEYLLDPTHPDGASKAEFFARFGFRPEQWQMLAEALRKHGATHPVSKMVESNYGTRYAVDGELEAPDGRKPLVRTVWMREKGSNELRLITAYPVVRLS